MIFFYEYTVYKSPKNPATVLESFEWSSSNPGFFYQVLHKTSIGLIRVTLHL